MLYWQGYLVAVISGKAGCMQGEAAATVSEDAASKAQDGRAPPHTDNGSNCRSTRYGFWYLFAQRALPGCSIPSHAQVQHEERPTILASVDRCTAAIDLE